MQLLGRLVAGFSAPTTLLMLMVRALILLYVPPYRLNICSLDSWKGGVGQNGAHDAFRGGRPGALEILSCGGDFLQNRVSGR